MSDIVAEMLGNSDNNTAEMVVKELGFQQSAIGGREAGLAVIENSLAGWAVDTTEIVLADGSGLSPDNRATCTALLTVLQRSDPDGPIGTGLPVAGQTGTLADIFVDHPIAGRLLGKTGTLSNPPFNEDPPAVKALAGYVGVDGGSVVEYALVLNGPTISDQSEYRPVWNALADVLVDLPEWTHPRRTRSAVAVVSVDLVAPPVRYPRTPVLLLILVALIPVAGLTGLLMWSDTKADEYEAFAAVDEAATTTTIAGEATVPAPVVTPLRTGLLNYRRAPTAVGAVSSANALAEQVEQIYGYVGDRSCAAVSVDGRHVTGSERDDAGHSGEQPEAASRQRSPSRCWVPTTATSHVSRGRRRSTA